MNALVASLNFNPGHFSHLAASYKLFAECGLEPCLYVADEFNKMDKLNAFRKINRLRDVDQKRIDHAIFWFPSLKNPRDIARLKLSRRTQTIYVLHEPFDSFRNYRTGGFSQTQILKIALMNCVNVVTLTMADRIILPSRKARAVYEQRYASLNSRFHVIPLIFDDESTREPDVSTKNCISYIGTIGADHAFDMFVRFVEESIREGWFPDLKFLVATRSRLPASAKSILHSLAGSNRVRVLEGRPLSDEAINSFFSESCVVWNAYNRSMQSGVLAKAYMFGAPVLVLARNANEFIVDRSTGVLIENNSDAVEIRNAVIEIRRNLAQYARNCRQKFLETFYYRSQIHNFKAVLGV